MHFMGILPAEYYITFVIATLKAGIKGNRKRKNKARLVFKNASFGKLLFFQEIGRRVSLVSQKLRLMQSCKHQQG